MSVAHSLRHHRESFDADAFLASVQERVHRECGKKAFKLRSEIHANRRKLFAQRQDFDQPLTTLEEIWEQLCCSHGPSPFSIEEQAMLDILRNCQDAGLGPRLNVALSPKVAPKNLVNMEWRDYAYLFASSLDTKAAPIEGWRAQLSAKRSETDFCVSEFQDWLRAHREETLNLAQFKRLIPAIADVMQLDEENILSVLAWVVGPRFEMPSKMYQLFVAKVSKERLQKTNTRTSADDIHDRHRHTSESKVEADGEFTRNDFNRLCYSLDIVDHSEQSGKMWAFWSAWWDDLIKNMPDHIEDYITRRPGHRLSPPAQPRLKTKVGVRMNERSKRNHLEGRTELSVFLELLFKQLPEHIFASPLDMCITFLSLPENAEGDQLKQLFRDRDENGNVLFDYTDVSALLRSGNPNMADQEITELWNCADKNRDGMPDFEEFVDFIVSDVRSSSDKDPFSPANGSMEMGRESIGRKRLRQIFTVVSGRDEVVDSQEFSKLCRNANLYDGGFRNNDADIIFAKACRKGERKLKFAQFQTALRLVAEKKDSHLDVVHAAVAEALDIH